MRFHSLLCALLVAGCSGSVDHGRESSAAATGSGGGSGSTTAATSGSGGACQGTGPICTACDSDVQPDATCEDGKWVCPPGYSAGPVDCEPPPNCCRSAADCNPDQTCVELDCKPLIDGKCWTDEECGPNEHCEGASPCPCGLLCDQDEPGECVAI